MARVEDLDLEHSQRCLQHEQTEANDTWTKIKQSRTPDQHVAPPLIAIQIWLQTRVRWRTQGRESKSYDWEKQSKKVHI